MFTADGVVINHDLVLPRAMTLFCFQGLLIGMFWKIALKLVMVLTSLMNTLELKKPLPWIWAR
jgi:hypothetical protein